MATKTTITINGVTHVIHGNAGSVSISNGELRVDGKIVGDKLSNIVEIKWDGPLASLHSDASVTCGDVHGNVRAGNSVTAKNVQGDVRAANSVTCGNVGGNVSAGNNVSKR
jgi:hypothetical protein